MHVGAEEVDALLEEVRRRVRSKGQAVWWIGPSAEPSDVYERLGALGLAPPQDRTPLLHAQSELVPESIRVTNDG